MQQQSAITRTITVAAGVFAPGHLGELTQILDFDLVDAVVAETGTVQRRVRLLPSRVLVFFVLAMQCLPTLAVTRREAGSGKVALLQFAYMTALAYGAALVTHHALRHLGL